MVNGAPPATTALPRRRNLVRNALREIEKIVPSAQWETVVIQPDQTVRVSRIGSANSSAAAQPAGTATSTTASQSARRSVALTARQIKKNRRAADHQAALASSARLASGAAPAADAPSADASAGGPSQSAIAAASAAPSPAEHHHHPNSVAAVFTASCDITASASAAAACASAPAARNSRPGVPSAKAAKYGGTGLEGDVVGLEPRSARAEVTPPGFGYLIPKTRLCAETIPHDPPRPTQAPPEPTPGP